MTNTTLSREELKKMLVELLRSDWEFRRAVAAELGLLEILERLDRHEERMVKLEERMARIEERLEEHSRAIVSLQEQVRNLQEQVRSLQEQVRALQEQMVRLQEQVKILYEKIEEHSKAILALQEEIKRLGDRLMALGAGWGVYAEEAFREALRKFLQEYLGVAKVEKWERFDREGEIFGYPTLIEIDVIVKDDVHYLVEIKSSVSASDVKVFNDKCRFYQKVTGAKKVKKMIVTCYADNKAKEAARALGVEIVTR